MNQNLGVAEQARRMAEQQKDTGADVVEGIAEAIHGAAHELESRIPGAAEVVHAAAGRLEGAAAQLHERNVDELIGGLGTFARQQPATFFGGAVLTGFALSRFLKSSGGARSA